MEEFKIPQGLPCKKHKKKKLSYNRWHEMAEKLQKKGIKQTQCEQCNYWLFPNEY